MRINIELLVVEVLLVSFFCLCSAAKGGCANGSTFNAATGVCDNCPVGMGGARCTELLCGSLTGKSRPLLQSGASSCACDSGWKGLNCNVCMEDSACYSSAGATGVACEKRGVMANKHYKSCVAKLPDFYQKILGNRPLNVLIACSNNNWDPSALQNAQFDCGMQLFLHAKEQFYCQLSACKRVSSKNSLSFAYECQGSQCRCVEGTDVDLCSTKRLIDLSPLLQQVSGKASVECDQSNCSFNQGNLNDFFQGGIQMECLSGECLSPDILPGLLAPKSNTLIRVVYWMGIVVFSLTLLAFIALLCYLIFLDREMLKENHSYLALSTTPPPCPPTMPCKLSFFDVRYSIATFPFEVLHGVSGIVEPGQLLGIMGNSGSGKTTLLEILGQKTKSGSVHGDIFLNDAECSQREMRRISGFVEQEDVLMGTLTVRESLTYSAYLRLSTGLSPREKRERIDETLAELGIAHIQHSRIGTVGLRGISGGEKRRVMIAQELCSRPSILFLDEPTSGLDSSTALSLIRTLHHLAKRHQMTIIMTIHQPRSNIFALLDSLILLSKGRQLYFGEASKAREYFAQMNFHCPPGYNIADFIMDVSCNEEQPSSEREEQRRTIFELFNGTTSPNPTQEDLEGRTLKLANHWDCSTEASLLIAQIPPLNASRTLNIPIANSLPTIFPSFCILSCRTMRNIYRNPYLLASHYAISILLAVFCGTLFWNITNDMAGVQNRLGCIFFICAFFAFSSMTCLEFFSSERSLFLRERSNGFYSPGPWFFAKGLFDLVPLRIIPPIIFVSIIYPMVGLVPRWISFFRLVLALVFFNLACASTSLFIAIIIEQLAIANLIASIWILGSMLFGGFLLNKERISPWLSWLKYLSLFNWAFEAMIVNELGQVTLRDRSIVDIAVPGAIILRQFGFNTNGYNQDVIALIAATVGLMGLGYLALVLYVKERR